MRVITLIGRATAANFALNEAQIMSHTLKIGFAERS
jgi:hypothetical protein